MMTVGDRRRHLLAGKRPADSSGQATLEFALTAVLLFAFIFFFIQLSLTFAWGNYIHYATFMSARAYLSSGFDRDGDQAERARKVIIRMVKRTGQPGTDRFKSIARGTQALTADEAQGNGVAGFMVDPPDQYKSNPGVRDFSWMEGVRYAFSSRLFIMKIGGVDNAGSAIDLTAESWLGREKSYQECIQTMGTLKGEIDNGC